MLGCCAKKIEENDGGLQKQFVSVVNSAGSDKSIKTLVVIHRLHSPAFWTRSIDHLGRPAYLMPRMGRSGQTLCSI
jgi:hypothetical protein